MPISDTGILQYIRLKVSTFWTPRQYRRKNGLRRNALESLWNLPPLLLHSMNTRRRMVSPPLLLRLRRPRTIHVPNRRQRLRTCPRLQRRQSLRPLSHPEYLDVNVPNATSWLMKLPHRRLMQLKQHRHHQVNSNDVDDPRDQRNKYTTHEMRSNTNVQVIIIDFCIQ